MAEVVDPTICPLCKRYMGPYGDDIHMILEHPETRRKPDPRPSEKKGKKRGKGQ